MQFGPVPLSQAGGAILAHALRPDGRLLRKGRILTADDLKTLAAAGISEVVVARLGCNDIAEDEAAARIANASAGEHVRIAAPFTGRVNLYAACAGVACIDPAKVLALNAIDESITIATLAPFARVEPGRMLATIKIIPFAAPRDAVEEVETLGGALVSVAPFAPKRAALVSTFLSGTRDQVLDKNVGTIRARLESLGSKLVFERRVAHSDDAIAAVIADALAESADPVLVFGASAITDRRDAIPSAIAKAGGTVARFGMPVDPGNLLLLGEVNGRTVIGLPGCARSPKRNGFDFVLERVLAGITVSSHDIAAMGVGGLLAEIASRPQPRDTRPKDMPRAPDVAAIVLAAGLGSRMGHNKLTARLEGKALLLHAVEAALASHATEVIVVTGNARREVESALNGLAVKFVHNPDYREGLSTSLKTGVRAVSDRCDGAIVLLGDMPRVRAPLIDRLIAAFDPEEGRAICVATHDGRRGNPVLWARTYFPDILALEGDVGAKHVIAANDESVCEVEAGNDAPLVDIDTPEALALYESGKR